MNVKLGSERNKGSKVRSRRGKKGIEGVWCPAKVGGGAWNSSPAQVLSWTRFGVARCQEPGSEAPKRKRQSGLSLRLKCKNNGKTWHQCRIPQAQAQHLTMLVCQLPQFVGMIFGPGVEHIDVGLQDAHMRANGICQRKHVIRSLDVRGHRQVGALAGHELEEASTERVLRKSSAVLIPKPVTQ